MRPEPVVSWVVYQMPVRKKPAGVTAMCEQTEWDEMQLARPGFYTLIQGGICSEREAEKLARDSQVMDKPVPRLKSR